ncbi:MAG: tetratricopeptide repeat protein [Bacteroidota bacterium]
MRILISSLLLVMMFFASAQEEKAIPQDSVPFEVRKQAVLYNLARKYNDLEMQKSALYNLYVFNPNVAFLDSLAMIYFDQGEYVSAGLIAQDASTINPDDMLAVEVAAVSFDNVGASAKAIDFYEKLYVGNGELGTLYRIMYLQYNVQRYEEAMSNADIIIADPKAKTSNLYFPVSDQQNQLINLEVAAYRMKGMIEQAKGNKGLASQYFNKALELAPSFVVLKKQIEELNKTE